MDAEIADRLRQTLKDCGLPQSGLEAYGLPHRSVQKYVSGDQKPGSEALANFAKGTGVNVHWLLTGEGEQFTDRSKMKPRPLELADITELMGRFTDFDKHFAMRVPPARKGGVFDGEVVPAVAMQAVLAGYQREPSGSLTEEHARVRDELMPELKGRDVAGMSLQEVGFALGRLEEAWEADGLPIP